MKKDFFAPVLLLVCSSLAAAQTQPQPKNPPSSSESRPRVVSPAPSPSIPNVKVETDSETVNAPKGTIVGSKPESRPPVAGPTATERHAEPLAAASRVLSPPQIQSRIVEAERLLKSRPLQTAKHFAVNRHSHARSAGPRHGAHSFSHALQRQLPDKRLRTVCAQLARR